MSVFATKDFVRFARKARLADARLLRAAWDVSAGRYDADLGGGVFKQRISREGAGKSGGYRVIIFFRSAHHTFFAYGFAKNDRANVSTKELKALKRLAEVLLDLSDEQLVRARTEGELIEVTGNGEG